MRLCGLLLLVSTACWAGESGLIDAIKDQDRKAVMALIQNHSNVNAALPDGSTPLSWAAYENDAGTVDLLLKAGAKVNVGTSTARRPLLWRARWAMRRSQKATEAGADANAARGNGETALMIAAGSGNPAGAGSDRAWREVARGRTAEGAKRVYVGGG